MAVSMRSQALVLVGAVGALASGSLGQDSGSAWDGLKRVEPGRSDLGTLALESRIEPVEMRLTEGFESLWRGDGAMGQTWFARRDGGVTAVFDRSDYVQTAVGAFPLIPAGTTFVIGEPNSILARRLGIGEMFGGRPGFVGSPVDVSAGLLVSTRIDTRLPDSTVVEPVSGSANPGGVGPRGANGDRLGVSRLLRLAASREKAGG